MTQTKTDQIEIAKISFTRSQQKIKILDGRQVSKRTDEYKYWLDRSKRMKAFIQLLESLQCSSHHSGIINFGKCEMQSGEYHVIARCSDCHQKIGQWVRKDKIPLDILDNLPVFESYLNYNLPCEVCGDYGVELHHWGPKELFPDTFERWPKSYLCPKCHQEWHNAITNPLRQLKRQEEKRNGCDTLT